MCIYKFTWKFTGECAHRPKYEFMHKCMAGVVCAKSCRYVCVYVCIHVCVWVYGTGYKTRRIKTYLSLYNKYKTTKG